MDGIRPAHFNDVEWRLYREIDQLTSELLSKFTFIETVQNSIAECTFTGGFIKLRFRNQKSRDVFLSTCKVILNAVVNEQDEFHNINVKAEGNFEKIDVFTVSLDIGSIFQGVVNEISITIASRNAGDCGAVFYTFGERVSHRAEILNAQAEDKLSQ